MQVLETPKQRRNQVSCAPNLTRKSHFSLDLITRQRSDCRSRRLETSGQPPNSAPDSLRCQWITPWTFPELKGTSMTSLLPSIDLISPLSQPCVTVMKGSSFQIIQYLSFFNSDFRSELSSLRGAQICPLKWLTPPGRWLTPQGSAESRFWGRT